MIFKERSSQNRTGLSTAKESGGHHPGRGLVRHSDVWGKNASVSHLTLCRAYSTTSALTCPYVGGALANAAAPMQVACGRAMPRSALKL